MVPFLHSLKFKVREAIATSILITFPATVIGALTYIFMGISKMPMTEGTIGYLHWPAFFAIISAGIIGIPLGAKLSMMLQPKWLLRIFAIALIVIAVKMLFH